MLLIWIEVNKYGADTLRLFTQFAAPFQENVPWDPVIIPGIHRFLNRVYRIALKKVDGKSYPVRDDVKEAFNKAISQINRSFHEYNWNVAISRIMDFVSEVNKDENVDITIWKDFIKLFAPFAPFITEELWEMTGEKQSVHLQKYPVLIEYVKKDSKIKIVITIDGKRRGEIETDEKINEVSIIKEAIKVVDKYGITSETKYTYIKGRIINFTLN